MSTPGETTASESVLMLGLMSGSSLDGIDVAYVKFALEAGSVTTWECLDTCAIPLPEDLKKRLAEADHLPVRDLCQLDTEFGRFLGENCRSIIASHGLLPDYIVSHGHTVMHHPEKGFTLQIGNPAEITEAVGCPVISDLRSADIAAGGQGAPLAPVVEKGLFPGYRFYLNLGGIANLTAFIASDPKAWDVIPCNQLLNFLANQTGKEFDNEGALARSGNINTNLLLKLEELWPLPLTNPASMDNAWVSRTYRPLLNESALSVEDKLATVTELIAKSVGVQIRTCPDAGVGKLLISGGGAWNTFLVERIRAHVDPVEVVVPEARIVNFKEAILMAYCGVLRVLGKPNAFASVTGASRDTVNGQITFARSGEKQ